MVNSHPLKLLYCGIEDRARSQRLEGIVRDRSDEWLRTPVGMMMLCVLLLLALVLNWLPSLDAVALEYLDEAITDNLLIYGTARALNGLISVIQSVQLSFSMGAGVAVQLGEALDPLNDLIERFSAFVLYALAGLGLQKIVLIATSSLVAKVLTSLLLIVCPLIWLLARERFVGVLRLIALIVLVRFCVVLEVGGIALMDKGYFNQQKSEAHSALELARDQVSTLRERYISSISESGVFGGLWDAAGSIIGDATQRGTADLAASAIVELIVIMLVRSILFPLCFIWLVVQLARRLLVVPAARRPDG